MGNVIGNRSSIPLDLADDPRLGVSVSPKQVVCSINDIENGRMLVGVRTPGAHAIEYQEVVPADRQASPDEK